MFVIVFEGTYNIFGPFENDGGAREHLVECGYRELGRGYMVNGDAYAFIKPIQPPRKSGSAQAAS